MNLPKFFGIDIGKNTTKLAQVTYENENSARIERLMNFPTGSGSIATEDVALRNDLALRIKDSVTAAKFETKKCILALPEPAVFNRLLTFPALDEAALNEAIHWNAKQFIPIPIDDVQMDWIKTADLTVDGKKMVQLLLVAAPKKLINQAMTLFAQADLELIAIETESVATSRVIAHNYPGGTPILILDIGSSGTDLSVISNGNLIFSQSLGTGSEAMTKAIAASFSLDMVQAEQYKIKFGMLADQGEGKIRAALEPVTNIIVSEVNKTLTFFKTKFQQSTPQRILILGEAAKTPGLAEFLGQKLALPTEVTNLQTKMSLGPEAEAEAKSSGLAGYAVAIGLAMKTQ